MQAKGFNHYVIFIASAFAASMYASVAMIFDTTSEVAIATSVLYLIPGVPLINGVIDIVEGHVLNGIARLTSALMLIVCIAVGLACTLMIVKNGLLGRCSPFFRTDFSPRWRLSDSEPCPILRCGPFRRSPCWPPWGTPCVSA